MKKQFLYANDTQIRSTIMKAEAAIKPAQDLFDQFKALGLPKIKVESMDHLATLQRGGEEWILNELAMGLEMADHGPLKVSPRKVIQNSFELPSFDGLKTAIRRCSAHESVFKHLSIVNGKVLLEKESKAAIQEYYSYYAETPDQQKLHELHTKAAQAMSTFNEAIKDAGGFGMDFRHPLSNYFIVDGKGTSVTTSPFFYEMNRQVTKKN